MILFDKCYHGFKEKIYMTKFGKEIDVSGDHYLNRISAVVEFLDGKSASKTLLGSSITYFVDWMQNLNIYNAKEFIVA